MLNLIVLFFCFALPGGAVQSLFSTPGTSIVVLATFVYDGCKSDYDALTQPKPDYDRSLMIIGGEKGNPSTSGYAFFVGIPKLVAAKGGLGSLTPAQARQIQGFADRFGAEVNVVGSRAAGRGLSSDFDYVIGGNSRLRHSADHYLPRGPQGTGAGGRGIDIFNANQTPLDPTRPFIQFRPGQQPVVGPNP